MGIPSQRFCGLVLDVLVGGGAALEFGDDEAWMFVGPFGEVGRGVHHATVGVDAFAERDTVVFAGGGVLGEAGRDDDCEHRVLPLRRAARIATATRAVCTTLAGTGISTI